MGGFSDPAVSAKPPFPPSPCRSFPQPCTLLHVSQAHSRAACAPGCLFKDACLASGLDRENAPPRGGQGDLFSGYDQASLPAAPMKGSGSLRSPFLGTHSTYLDHVRGRELQLRLRCGGQSSLALIQDACVLPACSTPGRTNLLASGPSQFPIQAGVRRLSDRGVTLTRGTHTERKVVHPPRISLK